MRRTFGIAMVALFAVGGATLPAQRGRGQSPASADPESLRCTALANVMLPDLPDAPTRIVSARLVDVPAAGLEGEEERRVPRASSSTVK